MRQGAGLVQGHRAQQTPLLEVQPALDQDAPARSGGKSADDGDRRRDHQGTRAGDDEQHERLVSPVEPNAAEEERRNHGDEDGQRKDRRCVDACEAVDETLRRRPLPLRFLHGAGDAVERRVPLARPHLELQGSAVIDRAGKHRVARVLLDRHALASDRRLIDGRGS